MEAGIYTVSELRIGNLLGFYKPEIREMQVGRVNEIYVDDEKTYRIILNEYSHNIGLTTVGVKPIQLTEEWLVKFGFKATCHSDGIKKSDEIHHKDFNHSCYEWCDNELRYTGGEGLFFSRPIRYIHDLQNLYCALTGEELISK